VEKKQGIGEEEEEMKVGIAWRDSWKVGGELLPRSRPQK